VVTTSRTLVRPPPGGPDTRFASLQSLWHLLIGRVGQRGWPCRFVPDDAMILRTQPLAPAEGDLAPLVLPSDIVHTTRLQARDHERGTLAAVTQQHIARSEAALPLAY